MYTMKEACEKTGLPYETLKFYCKEGLIPNLKRDSQNQRVFSEQQIGWIQGLLCLKRCGMGIAEMKEYLSILLGDDVDIPALKAMLERKRRELLKTQGEIQKSLAFIDWKQSYYDDVLAGKFELFHGLNDI